MVFNKAAISKAVKVFNQDCDSDEKAMEKAFLTYLEATNSRIIRNSIMHRLGGKK